MTVCMVSITPLLWLQHRHKRLQENIWAHSVNRYVCNFSVIFISVGLFVYKMFQKCAGDIRKSKYLEQYFLAQTWVDTKEHRLELTNRGWTFWPPSNHWQIVAFISSIMCFVALISQKFHGLIKMEGRGAVIIMYFFSCRLYSNMAKYDSRIIYIYHC